MGYILKIKKSGEIKEVDAFEYLQKVVRKFDLTPEQRESIAKDIKEISEDEDGVSWIQKRLDEGKELTIGDIHMAHIWGPGDGAVLGI